MFTWVLALEGEHTKVFADLLLQQVPLPTILRPLVLKHPLCWECSQPATVPLYQFNANNNKNPHLSKTEQSKDSSVIRTPDSWLKGCGFKSLQENFILQGQLSALTLSPYCVSRYCKYNCYSVSHCQCHCQSTKSTVSYICPLCLH